MSFFSKILIVIGMSGLCMSCVPLQKQAPVFSTTARTLRVATYNINFAEGSYKVTAPEKTIRVMKDTHADILLLQETTPKWQTMIDRELSSQYPYRLFKFYPNGGGLGVLSKYPIKTITYLHPHIGWHPAWLLSAETPLGNIPFLNIHLNPPIISQTSMGFMFRAIFTTPSIRLREIKFYYAMLQSYKTVIIGGDLNEGDYGAATKFLRNQGFIDALFAAKLQTYSWLWNKGLFTFNDRYDRIFSTINLMPVNVQVIHDGDSDHFPVVVDLKKVN